MQKIRVHLINHSLYTRRVLGMKWLMSSSLYAEIEIISIQHIYRITSSYTVIDEHKISFKT